MHVLTAPGARGRQSRAPGPGCTAGRPPPTARSSTCATPRRHAASRRCGLRAEHDYERVIDLAQSRPRPRWRAVPAPKRGEVVRLLGEELRRHKNDLGTLVSLENGKILAEGTRRGAGDDRHRRLRGRPVAHALRAHHAFGAPAAPHVRAVASAGRRRHHHRLQFPGRGVVLERASSAAICGNACVWKPSPKTPLTALAVQHLCNRVMQAARAAGDLPAVHRRAVHELARRVSSRTAASRWSPSPAPPRSAARSRERVAARLGKSLLELGGNNAVIVDESANLDLAVPRDRVRRGRHGRPALHHARAACSLHRAHRGGARAASGRTPTGRCASAIRWRAPRSWAR